MLKRRTHQRSKIEDSVLLNITMYSIVVCETAYVPAEVVFDFSKEQDITKTYRYNFDPLIPHFYVVKLGFTGVYIIFVISAQNIDCGYSLEPLRHIDCGYSLEPHRRGGSNEYPQSMFWAEIWKIAEFFSQNFQFLEVKFSVYLNRREFR